MLFWTEQREEIDGVLCDGEGIYPTQIREQDRQTFWGLCCMIFLFTVISKGMCPWTAWQKEGGGPGTLMLFIFCLESRLLWWTWTIMKDGMEQNAANFTRREGKRKIIWYAGGVITWENWEKQPTSERLFGRQALGQVADWTLYRISSERPVGTQADEIIRQTRLEKEGSCLPALHIPFCVREEGWCVVVFSERQASRIALHCLLPRYAN